MAIGVISRRLWRRLRGLDLTRESCVLMFWRLVVRIRRTSKKTCETSNNEPMKRRKLGIERVVSPSIVRSSADAESAAGDLNGSERKPGQDGRSRAETRLKESKPTASAHLMALKTASARLRPPSPTLIFSKRGEKGQIRNVGGYADLYGKSCGFLRIFPRCFTIFRTDQGRIYAIFGFPSPPPVRCPKWVVRLREPWSHFYE